MNYYNEIDPFAVQWLRNLIDAGHLPKGDVDDRSITEVRATDLKGYTQHHFFAGIGGWPLALRQAGWPDDKPVWTGSCPCFPAGTLVVTQRGQVPIQDVRVGDMVLTHRARWRPVTCIGSEFSEVVKVRGQGHPGLVCTPNHPFLTGEEEWTAAKDMQGRRWRTVAHIPEDPSALPWNPPERGVMLDRGKWRATGSKGDETVYLGRFTSRDEALSERRKAAAEGRITARGAEFADPTTTGFARFLGYWMGDGWATKKGVVAICGGHDDSVLLSEIMSGAGISCSISKERTGTRARCGSQYLSSWLSEQFGTSAENKQVPVWIHRMPLEYRAAFLQGYSEADGHTEPRLRRWTTVSRAIAIGVRILLNQQGVSASITFHKPNRKAEIEGRLVNERGFYRVTAYESSRSFHFNENHGIGYVRAVEPAGNTQVYNISVSEDESYCADGIVVHNCQPFSQIGLQQGVSGERHLWPVWYELIKEPEPSVVYGEQVASKAAEPWIDHVQADLEAVDYAVAAVAFPAASVGAPHIRDRLYWVGYADQSGLEGLGRRHPTPLRHGAAPVRPVAPAGDSHGLAGPGFSGETNGVWADADWLFCRDGKWRAVEPGTQPLADGVPGRMDLLRAYGNAIVVPQAVEFILASEEAWNDR